MNQDKITILLHSRESAERTVREIVARQLAMEKLIADRDAAIEKAKAKFSPEIDNLSALNDRDFELLETWADENREEFGAAKSLTICGHRLGWRTGNPKVEARGKLSFKTIVAQLVKAGGHLKARFIREKPELNKEAVLEVNRVAEGRDASLDGLKPSERTTAVEDARAMLKEIGVKVTQIESFYFEPDREGQPDVRMTGEAKEAA